MRFSRVGLLGLLAALVVSTALAGELPYLGSWSNGRGDTLVITRKSIRFASDNAVPYRDLTKATDGRTFVLEITEPGEVNFFSEKFLRLECGDDEMRMIGFRTQADQQHDKHAGSDITWYKEDDSAAD